MKGLLASWRMEREKGKRLQAPALLLRENFLAWMSRKYYS
jgi:hypothetical protein